ncbi:hypothetical protein ACFY8P_35460 [Streptomyces sp. NPDC012693]|uniref:hypothetical protein n=1 Tax=Streptomyces sp. NPDC012693 TaxID=3364844 RepID=UPI00369AC2ED
MPDPVVYAGQAIREGPINAMVAPHVQAQVGSFSVPTGASTYTAAAFTTTLSGNHASMWSLAQPTRLIAPSAGVYLVHGGVIWPAALGAVDARGEIRVSGASTPAPGTRVGTQRGSGGNMQVTAVGTVTLVAGGYVEIYLNTQSGSNIAAGVTLGITRISTT